MYRLHAGYYWKPLCKSVAPSLHQSRCHLIFNIVAGFQIRPIFIPSPKKWVEDNSSHSTPCDGSVKLIPPYGLLMETHVPPLRRMVGCGIKGGSTYRVVSFRFGSYSNRHTWLLLPIPFRGGGKRCLRWLYRSSGGNERRVRTNEGNCLCSVAVVAFVDVGNAQLLRTFQHFSHVH